MYYFVILTTLFFINTNLAAAQENETDSIEVVGANNYSTADIERGSEIFFRCSSCHSIENNDDGANIGPNLHGIFGRTAGALEGYENYSKVLKEAGFIWDEAKLDSWLKNPNGFLPGNTMAFSGILRQKDRDDIIAFIIEANKN